MEKRGKRKIWIDLLRSVAIFAVTLGHFTAKTNPVQMIIAPIMLPLFYIISGMLYKSSGRIGFWRKYILPYWVPYIVFSLYPLYLIKDIIQGQYNVALNRTVEFFNGEYSWFVPSFVISNLVFNGICRILLKKRNRLLMGIICLFVGILIKDIRLFDFWCIDAALCGVFYMVLGVSIVDQIDYLKTIHIGWIGAGTCVYGVIIAACISLYTELPRYDFHNVIYCNYFLCLAATLIGCVVLIAIFCRVKKENKLTMPFGMVGRNTLVIFLTHFSIKKYMSFIFAPIVPYNTMQTALFYSILVCLAGAIIGELTRNKMPILHGRTKIHIH